MGGQWAGQQCRPSGLYSSRWARALAPLQGGVTGGGTGSVRRTGPYVRVDNTGLTAATGGMYGDRTCRRRRVAWCFMTM